jgi:N-acetylneuraminate lyase
VKFTFEDLEDFSAARVLGGTDYDILFGRDEILLDGLKLGATGAVGSTYNYAAPLFSRIIAAHAAGDLATAEREQGKARAFIDVMIRFGGLPAGKAMMRFAGIDCGPVRLPLRAISTADERALCTALEAQGFFEYASQQAA